MDLFIILIAIKVIFLGAVYGRLDGGGVAKTSEWIERSLIMFFFVLACAPFAGYWAFLAYAGVLGIATGHGSYFLSRVTKKLDPERIDPVVRLIFGKDPRTDKGLSKAGEIKKAINEYGMRKLYWRNVFGMFCTGTLVGAPALILSLVFGEYGAALIFAQTGTVKSIAYMSGHLLFKNTESAEYINGALRNALCLIVIYLSVGSF